MPHIPLLGGAEAATFPLQFPAPRIDPASVSATMIHLLSNDGQDTVLSHASGCFWRHNDLVFLITARHVITGTDPFDDTPLSGNLYVPQRIAVHPVMRTGENKLSRLRNIVEIHGDKGGWFQDPLFEDLRTDIAAVPVMFDPDRLAICLNDNPVMAGQLVTLVGVDCTIVGYPTLNFSGVMAPIWRRASIASEPNLPIDGKPMFLIDAATSKGFSGAPVLRRHYGPAPIEGGSGEITLNLHNVCTTELIGVYAGRFQHNQVTGEVPFAFYANRIPEIFAAMPTTS